MPELTKFEGIIKEKLTAAGDAFTISLLKTLLQVRRPQLTSLALSSLPHTPFEIYQHFLDGIPEGKRPWSRKVLSWIIRALRPLKVTELAFALALQGNVSSMSELQKRLPQDFALDLQQVFGNLIKIHHDEVMIAHSSFREFLLQDQPGSQASTGMFYFDNHAECAESCLRYISLSNTEKDSFPPFFEPGQPDKLPEGPKYGFLIYAVSYWFKHYNLAKLDVFPSLREKARAFLEEPRYLLPCSWQEAEADDSLQRAALLGCTDLVSTLLGKPEDTVRYDDESLTGALDNAMRLGDETAIHCLWEAGARSDFALLHAAQSGLDEVTCQIFWREMKEESDMPEYFILLTALSFASAAGCHEWVRKLLNEDCDPNIEDGDGSAPLHLASLYGHVDVMDELLAGKRKTRVNVTTHANIQSDDLANAGAQRYASTDRGSPGGADINIRDKHEQTPLHTATRYQQPGAVKKLVERGANIDAEYSSGETALHIAAESGRKDIVDIFLSHYDKLGRENGNFFDLQNAINRPDNRGFTPLSLAEDKRHSEVAQQLRSKLEAVPGAKRP